VNHEHRDTTRKIAALVGLSLISMVCAFAQSPQTSGTQPPFAAQPRTIPLVSDACPAVRRGDKVSLDWNPGFEHPGMVEGLRVFNLRFGRVAANGVTVQLLPAIRLGGLGSALPINPIGNGYFHIELSIPAGTTPGEYHLIDATADAKPLPEYQGPSLPMTNSPVRERFCITIVQPPTPTTSGSGI